jgi:hypothetical protein
MHLLVLAITRLRMRSDMLNKVSILVGLGVDGWHVAHIQIGVHA